jgi:hypothetical protein
MFNNKLHFFFELVSVRLLSLRLLRISRDVKCYRRLLLVASCNTTNGRTERVSCTIMFLSHSLHDHPIWLTHDKQHIRNVSVLQAHVCHISNGKTANVTFYVLTAMNMDNTVFKECGAVWAGGSLPKYIGHMFSLSFLPEDGPSNLLRNVGKYVSGCMTSWYGRQNRRLRYIYSRFHRSVLNLFCGLDVHGSVRRNTNRIEITNKMRPCSRIYYFNVKFIT